MLLTQLSQIGAALVAGVFSGFAFDIYQRLCYHQGQKRIKAAAYIKGDIIFALAIIIILLLFWFVVTNGSLRWSVFLWLGIGIALYWYLFRHRLAKFFDKLKLKREERAEQTAKQPTKKAPKRKLDPTAKAALWMVGGYKQMQQLSAKAANSKQWVKTKLAKFKPKKRSKKEKI